MLQDLFTNPQIIHKGAAPCPLNKRECHLSICSLSFLSHLFTELFVCFCNASPPPSAQYGHATHLDHYGQFYWKKMSRTTNGSHSGSGSHCSLKELALSWKVHTWQNFTTQIETILIPLGGSLWKIKFPTPYLGKTHLLQRNRTKYP